MGIEATLQSAKAAKNNRPPFPISRSSPFQDGYDISAERVALADLVNADDPDIADPRYQRYVELERREALLKQIQEHYRHTGGAQSEVPLREAMNVQSTGKLVDESEDLMTLHTRDASRLFIGRAPMPGSTSQPMVGAKKVGAALRAVWYLSSSDNPYADFALIDAQASIDIVVRDMERKIQEMEEKLAKLARRGLVFSIVRADPPATVELGFKSPYGYQLVGMVSTFDFFVRMTKTLVRKDLLSDVEGHDAIYTVTKKARRIFERIIRFERYLQREELRPLCRNDWLATADEAGRKRVKAAVGLFGELPREVFNGSVSPRHSFRQMDLSEEELRLLNEVPLAGDEALLGDQSALQ